MQQSNNKVIQNIELAAQYLRQGELVAFPTETVYGLGADARNPNAIAKVFATKGRPADHPLIVHVGSIPELEQWALDVPGSAIELAKQFWPGPLTMILKKHPQVSSLITGGQDTIALRIPQHPLALALLKAFGSGLVGPSANKYGRVSPTTAEHVITDLQHEISAVLDGGPCIIGIESTIIDLTNQQATIMRQGIINAQQLGSCLHQEIKLATGNQSLRTSGSHASHYAPKKQLHLLPASSILDTIVEYRNHKQTVSVCSFQPRPANLSPAVTWQQVPVDPQMYAANLYSILRQHDQLQQHAAMIFEQVPASTEWLAIADRLFRASSK